MYQILIPKNRNLLIFQNERFKLWDYSKLESLMEPWPQFKDKKFAVEWVNYFLCKISLIFENEYDIEYANVFALKNLDTNEILLYWCKEVMFNSADKKNVTLTLVMDVFSKEILKNYKLTGTITQSTLPECRYYYKDNKLVFDNANLLYDEGFQFPKTGLIYENIYNVESGANGVGDNFYYLNQILYNPLHYIFYNTIDNIDYGKYQLLYIFQSKKLLVDVYDVADSNVLKIVSPVLYFSHYNIGNNVTNEQIPDFVGFPTYSNGVKSETGININGLVLSPSFGDTLNFYYGQNTYNNQNILIKFYDDFYESYGISSGVISLFRKDLITEIYELDNIDNINNYFVIENEITYLLIDKLVIENGTLLETINFKQLEDGIKLSDINWNDYYNIFLARFLFLPYFIKNFDALSYETETNSDDDDFNYENSDEYTKTTLYKEWENSGYKPIGYYIEDLESFGNNQNFYTYRFESQLYTDENYDIKLSLSSIHNKLFIIGSCFTYEITSYESFIYNETLIGYLQEFITINENNKLSITFKNRDNEKYINVVDCYDFYIKKSNEYVNYLLTNGSQYMTSKSYANTMVDLTNQMNSAKEGMSIFDSIMSIFGAVTSTGASVLSGASEFGVVGAGVMGANAGVRGIQNIGDSVGNIVTTQIQNQMNLATAQNAVNMLNSQAQDLKRNLSYSYSNKAFDYIATLNSYGGKFGDILLCKISYTDDVKDKINWFYKLYGWKNGNQYELTSDTKKSPKFDYIEMQNIFTTGLPAIWKDMVVNFLKAGIWLINDETIEDINAVEFKENILYE